MSVPGSARLVTATHARATAAAPEGAGRARRALQRPRRPARGDCVPRREPLASSGCSRGSGRPGWLPATRRSSPVPGAGRARWRGGARPCREGSARRRPRARRRRGLRGAARELSLVLTALQLGPEAGRPPAGPGPSGAPAAPPCRLSWRPQLHSVGIWSRAAAAAAYPQCDLGASSSLQEILVLIFEMGHSCACKVALRMKFDHV